MGVFLRFVINQEDRAGVFRIPPVQGHIYLACEAGILKTVGGTFLKLKRSDARSSNFRILQGNGPLGMVKLAEFVTQTV